MDRQTAIERAKSALEFRIKKLQRKLRIESEMMGKTRREQHEHVIRLDTEALQALREWKPEEKSESTSGGFGEGRED